MRSVALFMVETAGPSVGSLHRRSFLGKMRLLWKQVDPKVSGSKGAHDQGQCEMASKIIIQEEHIVRHDEEDRHCIYFFSTLTIRLDDTEYRSRCVETGSRSRAAP